MKRKQRKGLSMLEMVIATIIMAVIAAMITVNINNMRDKSRRKLDAQNIARLNSLVAAYQLEVVTPAMDTWLTRLYTSGYTSTDRQPTPYGGNYRWDAAAGTVVNLQAPQ